MIEIAFAAALLLADHGTPVDPTDFETVRHALQMVAVSWEVLDERERRYVLTRPEGFQADLDLLRQRMVNLADAPPARDAERFPDRLYINDLLAFNRAYRQHLDVRQAGEPSRWWALRAAIQETDALYFVWDLVRDASCSYYYITVRRNALKQLREHLGPADYYNGILPPYVPIWRFQEITLP